ncbi:SAM-dependent methyltransferase [Methanofollis aquaemaris]|uniref:SAM-dependent methyltransferase n=1 Tax=Methanofollis aquaemaris TaxID=126734 RepID=A0A8A3S514_9EURY|nr:SAM-dependent methyltransferase [Methanofollis aquaemaris]QSZ66716.1 SAM-dependent methyltransferase [Methanofollis aquaemaris]
MRVRKVSRDALAAAMREEWLDRSRRPYVEGEWAYVPVREGYGVEFDLPERRPYRGRSFQMIGDTAVIHGARPTDEEVAAIVAWRSPACVLYLAGIDGVRRLPATEVLYGDPHPVCHHENGFCYWLNPAEVMFAQGNLEERRLMGRVIAPGERVADMFAGIGYFTVPMASAGAKVHAMEINPVSFGYLQRNIHENKLEGRVRPENGDCRDLLDGVYDRVVMGHFDAPGFFAAALAHAEVGTVIHLHALGDAAAAAEAMAKDAGFTAAVTTRKVKKYGPHIWHVVHDVVLS